jgi:hypothetical protein
LPNAWSRNEILEYISYCHERIIGALAELTEEKATMPLPAAHRFNGQPHGRIIMGIVGHTTEHAAQIRQFVAGSGIAPK